MSQHQHQKHHLAPEPPLSPDFPKLRHPDLDVSQTEDVEEPPNKDDVNPDLPTPEPPG